MPAADTPAVIMICCSLSSSSKRLCRTLFSSCGLSWPSISALSSAAVICGCGPDTGAVGTSGLAVVLLPPLLVPLSLGAPEMRRGG